MNRYTLTPRPYQAHKGFVGLLIIFLSQIGISHAKVHSLSPTNEPYIVVEDAKPGDIYELEPGTYRQSIILEGNGSIENPIVLRARIPGTVIINGAEPKQLNFTHVSEDLYVSKINHRVRLVIADGRNMMGYNSKKELLEFRNKEGIGGPLEGFSWEDGKLFVRLLNGQDPNSVKVEIHRALDAATDHLKSREFWRVGNDYQRGQISDITRGEYTSHETGVGLYLNGSYILVQGLRFQLNPVAAISIAQLSHHITIEDCYIFGSHRAVHAANVHFLTVRSCEHSGYPAYEWMRLTSYDDDKTTDYWGIGMTNMKMGFLTHNGVGTRVENCLVYEMYDAFRPRGGDSDFPSLYQENVMMSSVDEHIEYDTFWHNPLHLRVTRNFFLDALASQALSPVMGGYLTIDHNLLYTSPEKGLEKYFFKFDVPIGILKQGFSPVHNILIAHNTFVNGRGNLIWAGQGQFWGYTNCKFENNLWYVGNKGGRWELGTIPRHGMDSPWVPSEYNLIAGNEVKFAELGPAKKTNSPVLQSGSIRSPWKKETGPMITDAIHGDVVTVPGKNHPIIDFNLIPGSEAVDAGNTETAAKTQHPTNGSAPDLGALELNQDWDMPMPGPRWAVGDMKPWRPPLPASLDPLWVGLQEGANHPEHPDVFPLGEGNRREPMTLHFRASQLISPEKQNWEVINQSGNNDSGVIKAILDSPAKRIFANTKPDFTIEFELERTEALRFWFKAKAKGGGSNSFWFHPRGMKDTNGNWMMVETEVGDWTWVSWQGNSATFGPGEVKLDFHAREGGLIIEDILVTNEWNGLPDGPWNRVSP